MIETTIAGSLPKPAWLAQPERLWPAWALEDEALAEGQRRSAAHWIALQEAAGIGIVTDGEQFRRHFVHGFLERIEGIDWQRMTTMGIRNNRYEAAVPTVTGPVRRPAPVHADEVRFCRGVATGRLKVTLPGPMTICDTIADAHYGSRPDMAMAFAALLNAEALELAALGADMVQFDEPAFNAFTAEAADWGVAALDRALEGLTCATAVHICYGYGIKANADWKASLGSEWRQYEAFFPALNRSRVGQVSLECAASRVPASLMRLLPDKVLQVGAIDVATTTVESPQAVAAVLRGALAHVEAERLVASTNCGLAPLPVAVAEAKLRALGAGAALLSAELG